MTQHFWDRKDIQVPLPHVWNPITRQQFMLCEDALLFQYWDVKLHTGPLMHSGNHSLLLKPPAKNLSEDLVTGEEKSDSHSHSLFWPWLPSVIQYHCVLSCFPFSISPEFLGGGDSLPRALWQGDWWGGISSVTADIYQETLLGMPTLLPSPRTNRQQTAGSASMKKGQQPLIASDMTLLLRIIR